QRPPYNGGRVHMDHEHATVWGNRGPATRPLPAETNMRRGGFDGALHRDYQRLAEQLERAGISPQRAREMAREALQSEIDALRVSPPPRSVDPRALDRLPANALDQGR